MPTYSDCSNNCYWEKRPFFGHIKQDKILVPSPTLFPLLLSLCSFRYGSAFDCKIFGIASIKQKCNRYFFFLLGFPNALFFCGGLTQYIPSYVCLFFALVFLYLSLHWWGREVVVCIPCNTVSGKLQNSRLHLYVTGVRSLWWLDGYAGVYLLFSASWNTPRDLSFTTTG